MRLHPAIGSGGRNVVPLRSATMSTQIVAQVRDALFAKELRPGDFLGTEKDLAERFGVSRIVARDALRTLEAQGIVEIKVGSGGGARIAKAMRGCSRRRSRCSSTSPASPPPRSW